MGENILFSMNKTDLSDFPRRALRINLNKLTDSDSPIGSSSFQQLRKNTALVSRSATAFESTIIGNNLHCYAATFSFMQLLLAIYEEKLSQNRIVPSEN